MRPIRCPACQGHDLVHRANPMVAFHNKIIARLFTRQSLPCHQAACLDCGVVTTYLGEPALDQLRAWTKQDQAKKVSVRDF